MTVAYTAAQRRLTQTYQQEQLAIVGLALRDLTRLWPVWRVDADSDIDATWEPLMIGLLAVGEQYHRLAALRAMSYYTTARRLAGVEGEIAVPIPDFDREKAVANLMLLGPILTKKAIASRRPRIKDTALVRVSGAVTLMVMRGGRDTITAAVAGDPASTGYVRVTAGTCSWCLQLKAWGKNVGSGPGGFLGHTNCKCVAEPRWDPARPGALLTEEGGPFDVQQPFAPTTSGAISDREWFDYQRQWGDANREIVDRWGYSGAHKAEISRSLGAKLDARFTFAELREAANDWPGFVHDPRTPGMDFATKAIGEWASTSGDRDPFALAMQRVAADRFDLPWPPPGYDIGLQLSDDITRVISKHGNVMQGFVEEMYQDTQELLDRLYPGKATVSLTRGMSLASDHDLWKALAGHEMAGVETTVMLNPMSSFSVNRTTARGFGNLVIYAEVPKERIVGTAFSGYGCMSEFEMVVLGSRTPDLVRVAG